jgi:hypothetical protein
MQREPVTISLRPAVRKLVEKRARLAHVDVSRYVTGAIVGDALLCGDLDAVKLIGGDLRELFWEKLASMGLLRIEAKHIDEKHIDGVINEVMRKRGATS